MSGVPILEELRPRAFAVAYRMLGSVSEAEERREQLASSFLAAVSNGDLQALEELLAHDVVLHGDGGGQVRAITRPVHGRAKVARVLLAAAMWRASEVGGSFMRQVRVNGQPGAMVSDAAGKLIAVLVLDIADGHIQAVRSIVNPDKLRHLDQETSHEAARLRLPGITIQQDDQL